MLSKVNRLKGKANFDLVFKKGEKKYSPYFVVYLLKDTSLTKPQIGIVTSKKVGGAVVRNLVRRKISAALNSILPTMHNNPYKIVIIAFKGDDLHTVDQFSKELQRLLT